MPTHYPVSAAPVQPALARAPLIRTHFLSVLHPLLQRLDTQIDRRLVRTFVATIAAILTWRNRPQGLLLSELGAYILAPHQAPAGTKRLSNLLHSRRWSADLIDHWLWQQADAHVATIAAAGETPLVVWDESVLEKPESVCAADLCAVRSSKAARLKRIKPGFYNPPGGRPIHVPGLRWLGLLVVGQTHLSSPRCTGGRPVGRVRATDAPRKRGCWCSVERREGDGCANKRMLLANPQ